MKKSIGIGLIGLGTVGYGVWKTLQTHAKLIEQRTGISFQIVHIAVSNLHKKREIPPHVPITDNWKEVVDNPEVSLVVELIGGTSTACAIAKASLLSQKPVITGNKALLALKGEELFTLSKNCQTPIYFEAAVGGAIPIVRAIKESLVGNNLRSIVGIINGTSNYILEQMDKANLSYQDALQQAQELGYAEADPSLDVNGWDAAHKALLLATLAYGFPIDAQSISVHGIEEIRPIDLHFAKRLGFCIKLLNIVFDHGEKGLEIRTQPSLIPKSHMLANVQGVFNAVEVNSDLAGKSLFYGQGAGELPTTSSVIADIIAAGQGEPAFCPNHPSRPLIPIEETSTPYFVRFHVKDQPGVIAQIAAILSEEGVGISGVHSPVDAECPDADFVDMVFTLHTCPFGTLKNALNRIESLESIEDTPAVFRIETLS